MYVKCVTNHSLNRVVCRHTTAYTVESILSKWYVINHSINRVI